MKRELVCFDVFPKVVPVGRPVRLRVHARSPHTRFAADELWQIHIIPMDGLMSAPKPLEHEVFSLQSVDGDLEFEYCFQEEQQYTIWICDGEPKWGERNPWARIRREQLQVYALNDDLLKLRPLKGNTHAHSHRSDALESPETVVACYREAGYDFATVTDHAKYEPSLEAIAAFEGLPIDLRIFPGEEVHAPENPIHIVNFGGGTSVQKWCREQPEAYWAEHAALLADLKVPAGIRAEDVASCLLVFNKIRQGGGLAILCHPYWIKNGSYNIPARVTDYFLHHTSAYDALELVNGSDTPQENLLQVAAWHNCGAPEDRPVVVGADDSHGSIDGKWFNIGRTYALCEDSSHEAIMAAIRKGLCCAVEQYHGERSSIYGSLRLVKLFSFLEAEYFPLHDALCREEGRLMLAHLAGEDDARQRLALLQGQTDRLHSKLYASLA